MILCPVAVNAELSYVVQKTIYDDVQTASRLIAAGKDGEAIRLLRQDAGYDPSSYSAIIHSNLAYAQQRSGHAEEAIAEGKKALQYEPRDPGTVYTIAIAYQDLGQFDNAISWLRRYIQMETNVERRNNANKFMMELADDRVKQDVGANNSADYLDQLKKNNDVEHWAVERLPIKVFIAKGTDVRGYRPVFNKYLQNALDTWCVASGKKLSYVLVNDEKKADLKISFTPRGIPMNDHNRNRLKIGLTTIDSDEDGVIKNVEMQIATVNAFDNNRVLHDSEAAVVCMHEVGHAMGLGHSTSVNDVMYFGSSAKQSGTPTKRDSATIARLYSSYPVVVAFVPKVTPLAVPIKFLPPPAFLPPKPPSVENLPLPLFTPPPLGKDKPPPFFVPPPAK